MMKYTTQDGMTGFCSAKPIKIATSTFVTMLLSIVLLLITNQSAAEGNQALTKSGTEAPRIAGILISDEGNDNGYVTQGKKTFPPTRAIYVTVDIFHAKDGIKVDAFIINSSKKIVEHGRNVVTASGNIAKGFKFSYPDGDWPSGIYKVEVKLSTGDTQSTTFELKK